jgi:hypothetical protein
MGSRQMPQGSSIGFLTTERWGREHGVGGGVKETGVLGWGGTIAGAVAVAVAVGLEAVGDATTAGALRCLVGVVGGVGRYEAGGVE